jgi:hypothetical protein
MEVRRRTTITLRRLTMPEILPRGKKMSIKIEWVVGTPGYKFIYKGIPRVSIALRALRHCTVDVRKCLVTRRVLCPNEQRKKLEQNDSPPVVEQEPKVDKVETTVTPDTEEVTNA